MNNQRDNNPDSKLEVKFIIDIPASRHAQILAWCEAYGVPSEKFIEFALMNYFKEMGVDPEDVKSTVLPPQQQLVLDTVREFARRGETLRMRLFEDE